MLLKHGNFHISTLIREERQSTVPEAIGSEISRTDFRLNICTRPMEGEQDQAYINLVAIDVACPLPLSTETFKRNMSRVFHRRCTKRESRTIQWSEQAR